MQVVSGHGCFGDYLHCKARRERTTRCHHCDVEDRDTAQHTLEHCLAWAPERRVLVDAIGGDLLLTAVVSAMVEDKRKWGAVSFCE